MSRQKSEHSIFMVRSNQMFRNQIKRARKTHQTPAYQLDELRKHIITALHRKQCLYCGGELTAKNFSGDHRTPVSRNGRWTLDNLEICCGICNAAKGNLDAIEYRELLNAINHWPPPIKAGLIRRLRAGARACAFRPAKAA
jgi:5-methylcytosine-specific restriction endonuclease McrA